MKKRIHLLCNFVPILCGLWSLVVIAACTDQNKETVSETLSAVPATDLEAKPDGPQDGETDYRGTYNARLDRWLGPRQREMTSEEIDARLVEYFNFAVPEETSDYLGFSDATPGAPYEYMYLRVPPEAAEELIRTIDRIWTETRNPYLLKVPRSRNVGSQQETHGRTFGTRTVTMRLFDDYPPRKRDMTIIIDPESGQVSFSWERP